MGLADRVRDLLRYERFGWDYEAINPVGEEELRWHRYWATKADGPILGLACGTARLLVALAKAGHQVTGLDLSETMLSMARAHVQEQHAEVRRRVRLMRQDMERFDLGEQFAMVMIADNSFRELPTRRQLLTCLRSIHRHLVSGGRLLIVERCFPPKAYPDGCRRFGWSEPKQDPKTGHWIRRRGQIRLHRNQRRRSGMFEYELTDKTGRTERIRCPWSAPVLDLEEYLTLFRRVGFEPQVFHDYSTDSDAEPGTLWCFVCSKP